MPGATHAQRSRPIWRNAPASRQRTCSSSRTRTTIRIGPWAMGSSPWSSRISAAVISENNTREVAGPSQVRPLSSGRRIPLLDSEAIEQPVSAGGAEVVWLHPPSGPREGCDEFHDRDAAYRAGLCGDMATMAAPWVLLVQLRQVRSSAGGNARPSGVGAGQHVVTVRREANARNQLAALAQQRCRSSACCCRCADRRRWSRRPGL